ncbi:MAG TPA: DUF1570 domain-containing protein [Thermoanaerobaculia bacterium]|jgi:tetratricopeptide (TPR) repeat protein|nr:DUF1570 domain-containing protein [Thermoanaerobaculia bacterium]
MHHPRLAFASALSALLLTPPAHALPAKNDSWIEVRTANFTLFSETGEKDTRRAGADLERLRDALSQLSPGLALDAPYPTWLYVFKNASSFRPYQQLYEGRPRDSGGYFMSRSQGNYVAIDGSHRGNQTARVYHEYIHYVTRNANLPLWLHEGLAEYYSTFEASKNEALVGLPIPEHVRWLRENPWIPLAQLFTLDENSKEYNEKARRGAFYAESWALTHYLLSGSPQRRDQLLDLLRLDRAGTAGKEAFPKVFGSDPAALEREVHTYVKSVAFYYTRSPIQPEANLAMQVRPMAWPDVLFRLGDLLANLGPEHRAAAEEHFRAALAARPDFGAALGGLGYLAELADRPQEARPLYEKAAKLAPDDFIVQYRYAQSLLDDPTPGSLRAARAVLTRTVALRPNFGEAWARLGYTYQADESLDETAVHVLETAHRLLPTRMDVVHNLAVVYARTGHLAQAEELIEHVLAPRADPDVVIDAREALLDEEYRHAEELVIQDKVAEALPLLERVRDTTRRPERRRTLELRVEEIRKILDFNHFVERYNQAVALANRGDVQGAIAILEPLAETVLDPAQAEQARNLLKRLKPPAKRKGPRV